MPMITYVSRDESHSVNHMLFNSNYYKVLHSFRFPNREKNKVQLSSKSNLELHLDSRVEYYNTLSHKK